MWERWGYTRWGAAGVAFCSKLASPPPPTRSRRCWEHRSRQLPQTAEVSAGTVAIRREHREADSVFPSSLLPDPVPAAIRKTNRISGPCAQHQTVHHTLAGVPKGEKNKNQAPKKHSWRNNAWNFTKFDFKNKNKSHIHLQIPENQQTSVLEVVTVLKTSHYM